MRARSYWASRLLPMPSMVVIARNTKVNLGGSSSGRSACVAKRSAPILARRLRREAFFCSGVIWFSHLFSALARVEAKDLSSSAAMRSMEKRSTPGRSTPMTSSASHASRGKVRLDALHHPEVIVHHAAAWVAIVYGEVARVRVAVKEAVAAELLQVGGRQRVGDVHLVEALLLELRGVGYLDARAILHAQQPLGAKLGQHRRYLGEG
eukprot:scaffold52435_cov63-Phaeocystis_antarctica.AAC.2